MTICSISVTITDGICPLLRLYAAQIVVVLRTFRTTSQSHLQVSKTVQEDRITVQDGTYRKSRDFGNKITLRKIPERRRSHYTTTEIRNPGLGVLTVMAGKNSFCWDRTLCRPLERYQGFVRFYCAFVHMDPWIIFKLSR